MQKRQFKRGLRFFGSVPLFSDVRSRCLFSRRSDEAAPRFRTMSPLQTPVPPPSLRREKNRRGPLLRDRRTREQTAHPRFRLFRARYGSRQRRPAFSERQAPCRIGTGKRERDPTKQHSDTTASYLSFSATFFRPAKVSASSFTV